MEVEVFSSQGERGKSRMKTGNTTNYGLIQSLQTPISSRNDPRGALKPLFDDYRRSIPSSLKELTTHPDKMLRLIRKKLELIPATYTVIETHLHDYDVPGGKPLKTRMTRMATSLKKAADESLGIVSVEMSKLGLCESDASPIGLNPSNDLNADDHTHDSDSNSNNNVSGTDYSNFVSARPVSIESVEEIAFECVKLLDAVGSSKGIGAASLNRSVATYKTFNASLEDNGSSSKTASHDDSNNSMFLPSKGLAKDGRISFFLLAYIDVIIGWIVSDVVRSHPAGDVLLDWGVLFRDHGVRPLPSFLYKNSGSKSGSVFSKYDRSTNTYYSFYKSFPILHDTRRSDCLNWMLSANLYKKSNYLQETVYKNYGMVVEMKFHLKNHTTMEKNDIYVKLYDLMVSTVLLMRDSPQDLLEDPIIEVVVGEVVNLWDLYDEYSIWRKTDQFNSIQDGVWRIIQKSQRETKSGSLGVNGGYDSTVIVSSADSQVELSTIISSNGSYHDLNEHEISFLERVNSTNKNVCKTLEYDLLDFRTAYLNSWSEFVYGLYDVLRKSNYDRGALRGYVYGYDPKVIDKIFKSYKSSPAAKYSVNGRLVCLMRMYHLLVFATSRLPEFGGAITPRGVVSDGEFLELLKLYVTINTIVGDARFFMRKLSWDYDRYGGKIDFDPNGPAGRYSSGLGYPAYCPWEESNPRGVVSRCGGVEWLDVKRIRGFVNFMEEESIDSFASMPEDYVRETILMSIDK